MESINFAIQQTINFAIQQMVMKHPNSRTIVELTFKKRIHQNASFR